MGHVVDCRGLACPQPLVETKKYLDSIAEGETIVLVDNEAAKNNISAFARNNGLECSVIQQESIFRIQINKGPDKVRPAISKGSYTLLISSNRLGDGDPELGAALMAAYFYALSESDKIPDDIIFLNSGVLLAAEGSDCLESLKRLRQRGVAITSCGTCLDFYHLKEKLAVGSITNMYTIIERMNDSAKTIKI